MPISHPLPCMYEIVVVGPADLSNVLRTALNRAGVDVISMRSAPDFDAWVDTLPDVPVPGLAAAVSAWFSSWGNGGGDVSTETCAQSACVSDHPRELAQAIYDEIAGYSKSPFDTAVLVMDALQAHLEETELGGA